MKCSHVLRELSAYFDGEAKDGAVIAEHLRDCPVCAEAYDQMARASQTLRRLTPPTVHPAFTTRVLAAVREVEFEEEAPTRRPLRAMLSGAFTTFAMAGAAFLVVWITRPAIPDRAANVAKAPATTSVGLSPDAISAEIQDRLVKEPDVDFETLNPLSGGRTDDGASAVSGPEVLAALSAPRWLQELEKASENGIPAEEVVERLNATDAVAFREALLEEIASARNRG